MYVQVIRARLRGLVTKHAAQDRNVRLLMLCNLRETSTDPRREPRVGEGLLAELLKSIGIERALEQLQRHGKLQDRNICDMVNGCACSMQDVPMKRTGDCVCALSEVWCSPDGGSTQKVQ